MLYNILNKSLILVLIIGSCVADIETVYGTKGSSIIFECPYKNTSLYNVRWQYVYNTSVAPTISEGTSISTTSPLYTRVSIVGDHTMGQYNLQLRQLQDSDEVVYRCSVGLQLKQYQLELLASPSSLTLQDVTDNKILGTEGQSLTLRCIATGGKPPPLVTITLSNAGRSDVQSVDYIIPTLQRGHDKQIVRCDANSSALTSPLVATATLYLYLKPQQPIFSLNPVSADETRPLVVSCTTIGSRPQASFTWSIGLTTITSGITTLPVYNTSDDTFTVTSTMNYTVDRKHDRQTVTCCAYNNVSTSGVNASTLLDIRFAPDITVNNETYDQNTEFRKVTCQPVGNPTIYTYYRWQHKSNYGELIRELEGGQNGALTLPSVSERYRYQDSGKYICTASNGITGRDGKIQQTGSGYVTVKAQPVFTNDNKNTEYGAFGKDVDIQIYVYSVPIYTKPVKWYKTTSTSISQNGKYIISEAAAKVTDTFNGTTVQLDGYRVTLTIKNLTEPDFNVSYRVEVSNGIGLNPVVYTILLLSASPPQTPVNFTLLSPTESSIVVQWEPAYNGGHEQTFHIQYRVDGSNTWELRNISDSKQTGTQIYTLSGLQDDTMYEVRMYAENKFNRSLPTKTVAIKTITADSQASQQIGPIIGGVGGAMAAIFIIIVVIWFVIFKRKKDSSTDSKATRSSSDLEVPDGLQHNILYQSAGSDFKPLVPKAELGKKTQKLSTSNTEYAEVRKPNALYAAVDKTQQKNVQEKKQKDKKKRQKKPEKKVYKAGNNSQDGEYANDGMSLKDMGEGEYANSEEKKDQSTSRKNQQGLEYADLSFTKQIPHKGKKPVIHGGEDRTLYSEVDHSKKAPPPPQESAYEETNFKHG